MIRATWPLGLIFVSLIVCLCTGLYATTEVGPRKGCRKVMSIGGCDGKGTCGVEYTDGTVSLKSYPVLGEEDCGV